MLSMPLMPVAPQQVGIRLWNREGLETQEYKKEVRVTRTSFFKWP